MTETELVTQKNGFIAELKQLAVIVYHGALRLTVMVLVTIVAVLPLIHKDMVGMQTVSVLWAIEISIFLVYALSDRSMIKKMIRLGLLDHVNGDVRWVWIIGLIILPMILIITFLAVNNYPQFQKDLVDFQPTWSEMVNSGYAWLQSYITILPTLESLQ